MGNWFRRTELAERVKQKKLRMQRERERVQLRKQYLETNRPKIVNRPKAEVYNFPEQGLTPSEEKTTGWSWLSRRVGLLAIKEGMLTEYDNWMRPIACTVLRIPELYVTQVKTEPNEGYTALQIGIRGALLHRQPNSVLGHLSKKDLPTDLTKLQEFRVTPEALVPIGTKLHPLHFTPGQYIDVQALTKGKGTQGPMKRWGFSGGNASHGASKSHRQLGSTGTSTSPGKVFKGKKMAGRMGHEKVTIRSLLLWKIDTEYNVLFVKGAIPGPKGGIVRVRDALFKRFEKPPPFPTYVLPEHIDPFEPTEYEADLPVPFEEDVFDAKLAEYQEEVQGSKKSKHSADQDLEKNRSALLARIQREESEAESLALKERERQSKLLEQEQEQRTQQQTSK